MKKTTKKTYYAVICPVCGFKTVGNWKDMQISEYSTHFWQDHFPKPYIKKEKR